MKKVAVVVGHNSSDQGAEARNLLGENGNTSEFKFHNLVADRMVELTSIDGSELELKRFNRINHNSYTAEINEVYARVDDWSADVSMELHFNSYNGTASGTETLNSGFSASVSFSQAMQNAMLAALGTNNRRLKTPGPGDRGYKSLHAGIAPSILTEPFFGDNPDDVDKVNALGFEGFAKMYTKGLALFFGLDEDSFKALSVQPEMALEALGMSATLNTDLSKSDFLTENVGEFNNILDSVNSTILEDSHGEKVSELTLVEAISVMNSELGLRNGKVDPNHVHSLGERGLLPLPSNIKYWNGSDAPGNTEVISPERNVKEFLLYMANLKNRDIGRTFMNGDLYQDLFLLPQFQEPKKQMWLLAASVHGWFYPPLYENNTVPVAALAEKVATTDEDVKGVIELLEELGYKHALTNNGRQLLKNRIDNLLDGLAIAESL